VRRVSNRSQQGLLRGETLNLTQKNAKAAFFIDCLCRRWRHVRSLEVNFQILIGMRAEARRGV